MEERRIDRIEFAEDYEVTPFHYELVRRIFGIERGMWASNESTLCGTYVSANFDNPDRLRESVEIRKYCLGKIKSQYGIDLDDIEDEELNTVVIGDELERRLEWERIREARSL